MLAKCSLLVPSKLHNWRVIERVEWLAPVMMLHFLLLSKAAQVSRFHLTSKRCRISVHRKPLKLQSIPTMVILALPCQRHNAKPSMSQHSFEMILGKHKMMLGGQVNGRPDHENHTATAKHYLRPLFVGLKIEVWSGCGISSFQSPISKSAEHSRNTKEHWNSHIKTLALLSVHTMLTRSLGWLAILAPAPSRASPITLPEDWEAHRKCWELRQVLRGLLHRSQLCHRSQSVHWRQRSLCYIILR